MRRADVIARLKRAEADLRARGVGALYLFGSTGRDEARPDSDVDVFVEPQSDARFGFLPYMDAYLIIRKALGADIGLGYSTREGSLTLRADGHRKRSHQGLLMAATKSPRPVVASMLAEFPSD